MKLKKLFAGIEGVVIKGSKDVELTGISNDSRIVAPGHLFIAKQGSSQNGSDFIESALGSGASAIVTDLYDPFIQCAQVIAPHPAALESILASRFYGDPTHELYVVGITGTKGKTTTTHMVHHLIQGLGNPCGLVGTVEIIFGNERRPSTLTTHSSIQSQKFFREMTLRGCKSVSFEVSSHGLEQGRTQNIAFDAAIFTNFTPDHLDYHGSLEEYALAKQKLLQQLDESPKKNKHAWINMTGHWEFLKRGKTPVSTFGIECEADLVASSITMEKGVTRCFVEYEGKREFLTMPLMGRFNVTNALGAIGIGLHRGFGLAEIVPCFASFRGAPGRLEQIPNTRGILVFVDYAHTGEALENVLKTLRDLSPKKLICVFGAGGNRDPQRRTKMAKASETCADVSIVTSDNPRNEDPAAICQEILSGFEDKERPIIELDRKVAIHLAISMAKPGDIVLIAGKGHEKVQILAHKTIPFDDCLVAKEALQE